jgi:hypothetical protein
MLEPATGDLILRGCPDLGFYVVDAGSGAVIAGPEQLTRAVEVALSHSPGDLWHQPLDPTGTPVGEAVLMLRRR